MKFITFVASIVLVSFAACEPETVVLGYGRVAEEADDTDDVDAGHLDLDDAPISDGSVDAEPK